MLNLAGNSLRSFDLKECLPLEVPLHSTGGSPSKALSHGFRAWSDSFQISTSSSLHHMVDACALRINVAALSGCTILKTVLLPLL